MHHLNLNGNTRSFESADAVLEATQLFLIERECKHCGAPMGVRSIKAEAFAKYGAFETGRLTNHHWDEVVDDLPEGSSQDDVVSVKLQYVTCSGCSSHY